MNLRQKLVMAGLVPAIHVFPLIQHEDVDARDKRGHDDAINLTSP